MIILLPQPYTAVNYSFLAILFIILCANHCFKLAYLYLV
jgi:hypothetical protein